MKNLETPGKTGRVGRYEFESIQHKPKTTREVNLIYSFIVCICVFLIRYSWNFVLRRILCGLLPQILQ